MSKLDVEPKSGAWSTLGSVALTVVWCFFAAGLFWLLFQRLDARLPNEEQFSKALTGVAWPFVVFALVVPVTLVVASNMRQLIGLKKTIDDAPKKFDEVLGKTDVFSDRIKTFQNDLNEMLDAFEVRFSAIASKAKSRGASGATPAENAEGRLAAHYANATNLFYPALRAWNERHDDETLLVTRGGGNRGELAGILGGKAAFSERGDLNSKIAEYLKAVFTAHLASRRRDPDPRTLEELDRMLNQLSEAGLVLQQDE